MSKVTECLIHLRRIQATLEEHRKREQLHRLLNQICFRLDVFFLIVCQSANLIVAALWFFVDHTK
jgi:hypothetical protein